MCSPFVLSVDSRAVGLALDDYLLHPDEGGGERARIRCSLSGLTWAVASLYDPMASSFSCHGTIQRRLSPLVPQGTTIGVWFTPRGLQAVGAIQALLVSHRCETLAPASVLPAGGPVRSLPFPTTSCANAAGSVGSHGEGRAA